MLNADSHQQKNEIMLIADNYKSFFDVHFPFLKFFPTFVRF